MGLFSRKKSAKKLLYEIELAQKTRKHHVSQLSTESKNESDQILSEKIPTHPVSQQVNPIITNSGNSAPNVNNCRHDGSRTQNIQQNHVLQAMDS